MDRPSRASRRERLASDRLVVSPRLFERISFVALIALTLIVLTGAAVRLTGSGLGCPDWPRCYGKTLPPLDTYALIEFGNRALSGLVGVIAVAVSVLAFRRRPYRRDLVVLAALLPLGVVAQAVLGGITVQQRLAPGYVMAHFALSMLILIAAAALAWRARHEPGWRPRSSDRQAVWAVRALVPLGAVVIFAGTAATAAGPHAGGKPHEAIERLWFMGSATLNWTIHRHGELAAALGLLAVLVWLWMRRRGADELLMRSLTALCLLLAAQGAVGILQYETQLPSELVWVHVSLASLTWLAILWSAAAAGRLVPREATRRAESVAPPSARASA